MQASRGVAPPSSSSKKRKLKTMEEGASFNIGFIGGGNLARAIVEGLLLSGEHNKKNIYASCSSTGEKYKKMQSLGINVSTNNKDIVANSDVIVIAVKPHLVLGVLDEMREIYKEFGKSSGSSLVGGNPQPKNMRPLVVSVATAITIEQLEEKTKISWTMSGTDMIGHLPVVRCLPTITCSVQAGITVYTSGKYCNDQDLKPFLTMFNNCGHCELVPEQYIDGFTAFSGSGVAFMGVILESLSDGGVLVGIPRPMADKIAAYTMMSTAKLVLERGLQPSEVRTLVASPAGTTIHGLKVMEDSGIRGAVMGAVQKATERAIELRPKTS